jgi:hypothetical protein
MSSVEMITELSLTSVREATWYMFVHSPCSLDPSGRGYFTVKDWGSQSVAQQVSDFTRLYLRVLNNGRRVGRDEVSVWDTGGVEISSQLRLWPLASGHRGLLCGLCIDAAV